MTTQLPRPTAPPVVSVPRPTIHGRHTLATFYGIPSEKLDDQLRLRKQFELAIQAAKATVLEIGGWLFEPAGGVTLVALLVESHASIHTWPEHGIAYIDVFTCGTRADPDKALDYLQFVLEPERVERTTLNRDAVPTISPSTIKIKPL
ncbi:adenosylmethionine decarboxylase [Streptosporangiaceae bacterium NEAU-GS5]|nr:adenosylmethionine decarboxylase [Streptosporangiaceae bacterium NEAU-GS5]